MTWRFDIDLRNPGSLFNISLQNPSPTEGQYFPTNVILESSNLNIDTHIINDDIMNLLDKETISLTISDENEINNTNKLVTSSVSDKKNVRILFSQ